MKWLGLLVALVLFGGGWLLFVQSGQRIEQMEQRMERLQEEGEDTIGIENAIQAMTGKRTFNGILLVIFSAVFAGIAFVVWVLPNLASRVAEGMYGSTAEVGDTVDREARALMAKGDYAGAITAFRKVIAEDRENRLPWTEIAKIQRQHLDDPQAAIVTLKEAMAAREWPEDDTAFFLFRLAEVWNEDVSERDQAVTALQQVIREFPETRHAMNARHKLREWGSADKYRQ